MTVQPSIVGSKIKRTKFFFGYRYMWTRCQLAEPGSYVGAGVRKDVTPPPKWTSAIIDTFINNSIAQKDFINSIAINVYHDGKEGLAQHFDDAVRFKQVNLVLFSQYTRYVYFQMLDSLLEVNFMDFVMVLSQFPFQEDVFA